jgi:hypothetical protein
MQAPLRITASTRGRRRPEVLQSGEGRRVLSGAQIEAPYFSEQFAAALCEFCEVNVSG